MRGAEVRRAFFIVWLVLTTVTAAATAAPFVFEHEIISSLAPRCESQARYGRPCSLCGMTTAFIDISSGGFDEARAANSASLPLYLGFCLNAVAAAGVLTRRAVRRRTR